MNVVVVMVAMVVVLTTTSFFSFSSMFSRSWTFWAGE
jgi:hypothetical protein